MPFPFSLGYTILLFAFVLGSARAAPPTVSVTQGDFAGLVDIGAGRRLYLECRGTGSPTVVLEDCAGMGAAVWSVDLLVHLLDRQQRAERPAVARLAAPLPSRGRRLRARRRLGRI